MLNKTLKHFLGIMTSASSHFTLPGLGAFVRAAALANLFPIKFAYFEQTKISYKIHPVHLK